MSKCIVCLGEVALDEYLANDFICDDCSWRHGYPLASKPHHEMWWHGKNGSGTTWAAGPTAEGLSDLQTGGDDHGAGSGNEGVPI